MVLGETMKSAKSVIEAFQGANVNILVQEFIKEADGDRHPRARHRRQGGGGDEALRARPASSAPTCIAAARARRCASRRRSAAPPSRAARTLGLNVCGVDMLRSNRGPLVLEVNSSPGIEGMEKATGVDVAGAMIEFLERHAAPGNTRTKGKG